MGAAAAIGNGSEIEISEILVYQLKSQIQTAVDTYRKFPLIVDPTGQVASFYKYHNGPFVDLSDPKGYTAGALNRSLVTSMLRGLIMVIKVDSLENLDESFFEPELFPKEVLDRERFLQDGVWQSVLKPKDGDPAPSTAEISPDFVLIICTENQFVPPVMHDLMHVFKIVERRRRSDSCKSETK